MTLFVLFIICGLSPASRRLAPQGVGVTVHAVFCLQDPAHSRCSKMLVK